MQPHPENVDQRHEFAAQLADSKRLNRFQDLSYISRYAERFSIDPDKVITKSFHGVMNFVIMWKEQDEFRYRYEKSIGMMDKNS